MPLTVSLRKLVFHHWDREPGNWQFFKRVHTSWTSDHCSLHSFTSFNRIVIHNTPVSSNRQCVANRHCLSLSLEIRRKKIMLFKIIHSILALDFCSFFGLTNYTSTSAHNYKLVKPICHNNARQFLFAYRRIDAWNDLPVNMVNALSLSSFKNFLKSCCLDRFVTIG